MEHEILLFSYFKGHGDGLHIACSNDGYHWQALNNDDLFLTPQTGKEKIFRDPCLYYGHDEKFHLVWTCGWNERGIGYASSIDLINWSPQRYLGLMEHEPKTRNCWAPEIFFDERASEYIIYWSSTIDGKFPETQPYGDDGYNHRLYYSTTKDFIHFSHPALLYDDGFNVIDGNIVNEGAMYLLFMKNETLVPPQKNIRVAFGSDPFSFGPASDSLTLNHYWAEGPTAVKVNGEWFVYFDKYKINEIGAIRSSDLKNWEDISSEITFPPCAQHGYVRRVPQRIVDHLIRKEPSSRSFVEGNPAAGA